MQLLGSVAALLAIDGATLLQQSAAADGEGGPFVLALGESPLTIEPNDRRLSDMAFADVELPAGACRSISLERLFRVLYRFGGAVYNTKGITTWKRKWRAEQRWMYCAVEGKQPLRETLAVVSLVL